MLASKAQPSPQETSEILVVSIDLDKTLLNTHSYGSELTEELVTVGYYCAAKGIPFYLTTARSKEQSRKNMYQAALDDSLSAQAAIEIAKQNSFKYAVEKIREAELKIEYCTTIDADNFFREQEHEECSSYQSIIDFEDKALIAAASIAENGLAVSQSIQQQKTEEEISSTVNESGKSYHFALIKNRILKQYEVKENSSQKKVRILHIDDSLPIIKHIKKNVDESLPIEPFLLSEGCNLSLLCIDKLHDIPDEKLNRAKSINTPILIMLSNNDFWIYGDKNGNGQWGYTQITSTRALKKLPFKKETIHRNDTRFTQSLVDTLKIGHAQLDRSFSSILVDFSARVGIKKEAENLLENPSPVFSKEDVLLNFSLIRYLVTTNRNLNNNPIHQKIGMLIYTFERFSIESSELLNSTQKKYLSALKEEVKNKIAASVAVKAFLEYYDADCHSFSKGWLTPDEQRNRADLTIEEIILHAMKDPTNRTAKILRKHFQLSVEENIDNPNKTKEKRAGHAATFYNTWEKLRTAEREAVNGFLSHSQAEQKSRFNRSHIKNFDQEAPTKPSLVNLIETSKEKNRGIRFLATLGTPFCYSGNRSCGLFKKKFGLHTRTNETSEDIAKNYLRCLKTAG